MWDAYPFYSQLRGIGVADVYHSHAECQVARSIAVVDRFEGTAGRPECACCLIHWQARAAIRVRPPQEG